MSRKNYGVVVESTCVPFLGIIRARELDSFLVSRYKTIRRVGVLFNLICFFIRITVLLANRAPPNLFRLTWECIELFRIDARDREEDLNYLTLLKRTADILIDKHRTPDAARKLLSLSHGGNERANAAIGFALAAQPKGDIGVVSNEYSEWVPIHPGHPSTMEVLVYSQLFGSVSLETVFSTGFDDFSVDTKVLVGLDEVRKKAFPEAVRILEPLMPEVESIYGNSSLEVLLIGIALVNSFNATKREADGVKLAYQLWTNVDGSLTSREFPGPAQKKYLMMALSDSFIGLGRYHEARELLRDVLEHSSVDDNLIMSATLRLLKMSRRERLRSTLFKDGTQLGRAVERFDKLSDVLKYECIEETVRENFRHFISVGNSLVVVWI